MRIFKVLFAFSSTRVITCRMQSLLFLGIIGLSAAQYSPFPNPLPFPFPPPGSPQLYRIWNDPNLTKQQFEEEMNKWAQRYGVKQQYDKYNKQVEDEKKELEEGLKAVSRYFRRTRELESNKALTYRQFDEKRRELFDKLTSEQKEAARFLECLFTKLSARFCVPGPMGPRPVGPGPMGPHGPFYPW
ncbi:hypothetical protein RB195_003380 [Necator americanus]|uniref:SXP/RAL-2 family protein Ani s 5-like cation-binding domain-containing protein n=1 Tax=Necator americanus TaxID=51031 RepID=A0ABR1DNA6_NECAM